MLAGDKQGGMFKHAIKLFLSVQLKARLQNSKLKIITLNIFNLWVLELWSFPTLQGTLSRTYKRVREKTVFAQPVQFSEIKTFTLEPVQLSEIKTFH